MKSWKTTLGGITAIIGGVGIILNMISEGKVENEKLMAALAAIGAGWTGLHARDNNVTSEKAGAK